MSTNSSHTVRLADHQKSTITSKVRTQFNALVTKLDAERKRLAAWHDAMPRMRARADAELMPLGDRFCERQRELIKLFDATYQTKKLTKKEREKLSDLICNLTLALLDGGEDAELIEIYERHSGQAELADDPDFMALNDIIEKMMNDALENGGDPFGPPQEDAGADATGAPGGGAKAANRKPSAAAIRKEAEEARLAQSVREIFRKLASALHPDREVDPAERTRKTGLMQRANVAYAANDLLGLLELQFEVDQIDASKLDTLGEERIKQYNKVLTKQVAQVRREIDELEHWLEYAMGVQARGRVTPAQMEKTLTAEIETFKRKITGIELDLQDFQDIKILKSFLKTYRIERPMDFMDDDFF
ncbi:MAG: hypothetical protein WKG03_02290 [Telluria sp.]